jgi:hypothetical protein
MLPLGGMKVAGSRQNAIQRPQSITRRTGFRHLNSLLAPLAVGCTLGRSNSHPMNTHRYQFKYAGQQCN